MSRTVQCIVLGEEKPGLDRPPYPGDLGQRLPGGLGCGLHLHL